MARMLFTVLLFAVPAAIAYHFWGYWGIGISLVAVYLFMSFLGSRELESEKDEARKNKPNPKGLERRRKSAIASLDLKDEEDILILDTETTGLDKNAEIIEIAIIRLDGSVVLNTLVKPLSKIPRAATRIHQITNKMVSDAPSWKDVYQDYKNVTHDKKILVYNADYDKRLIRQTCKLYGLSTPRREWGCVMLAYAEYHGQKKYDDFAWQKLSHALLQMGIESSDESHRALSDCLATSNLVQAMRNQT
jgi:DNA polymerase III subunit epsilon